MDKYIKYKQKYLAAKQTKIIQQKELSVEDKLRSIIQHFKKIYGDGNQIQRIKLKQHFTIKSQSNQDLSELPLSEKNKIILQRIKSRQKEIIHKINQIEQIIKIYLKLNDPNNQKDIDTLKEFKIYLEFIKQKINKEIMSKGNNIIYTINCYNQLIPGHNAEAFFYYDSAKKNKGLNSQQIEALTTQHILKSGRKQIKEKKEKEKISKYLIDKLKFDNVFADSLKILLSNIIFVETSGVELNGHLIFDNKTRGTMTIEITPPPFLSKASLYKYLNFKEFEKDRIVNYKQWLNMSLLAIKNCINQIFMTYQGKTKTRLYSKIEELNSILNVFESEAAEWHTMELIVDFVKIVFDSQASDEDPIVKEIFTGFTWTDLIVIYYTV